MKIARPWQDETDTIPIAPLIDIVFLTLIFFMVTSVYAKQESEVDVTLPTSESAAASERVQGEIFINIRADGVIVVNDREMDLPELQGVLDRVAEYFPGGAVIIRGDREVVLERAIAVLDCCRKADIQNVSFAALESDEAPAEDS